MLAEWQIIKKSKFIRKINCLSGVIEKSRGGLSINQSQQIVWVNESSIVAVTGMTPVLIAPTTPHTRHNGHTVQCHAAQQSSSNPVFQRQSTGTCMLKYTGHNQSNVFDLFWRP